MAPKEVDWDRLDKQKFFVYGVGVFSGVLAGLYPLTVIKTRLMTDHAQESKTLTGAFQTIRKIGTESGVRGYYRGLSTVVMGTIPSRVIYLNTLEFSKAQVNLKLSAAGVPDSSKAAIANFVAGASASMATQTVAVPIDVISQRQMVHKSVNGGPSNIGGMQVAREILAAEGVLGLYRGYMASLGMFVPSSAIWWGCYGFYSNVWWSVYGESGAGGGGPAAGERAASVEGGSAAGAGSEAEGQGHRDHTLTVQTLSGISAGLTSSLFTTPLDVVKTRLQVAPLDADGRAPSIRSILRELMASDGAAGLWRGLLPRMINVSLWGTTMVSAYEYLKRHCAIQDEKGSVTNQ